MNFSEFWHLLTTINVVTVVTFILALIAIAHMLSQRHKPSSMIAWFIIILVVPYIGIPFYVIFSGRKIDKIIKSKRQIELKKIYEIGETLDSPIERLLRANEIAGAVGDNDVYICKDGVEAYFKLLDMIKRAKKCIYITTYILKEDKVTKEIIKVLSEKAKEGVDVKLLIDSIGSLKLEFFPFMLKELKEAGGEYRFFMSVLKKPITSKLNLRNHRKMIIVDTKEVMSGGMNIAKEYLSPFHHSKLWVDLSFILKGKAALHYYEIFKYDWEFETGEILPSPSLKNPKKFGESIVQVVPSGPDVERDGLYEAILAGIFLAKDRIWILSPYFVPDDSLLDALVVAKHKGVDVKIITAKISDHFFVDIARRGYLRALYEEGIEILLYKNKMIHAKAVLIDEDIGIMGSSNFDIRSFFYNFEVVSFCYTKKDIENLKIWMEKLFGDCEKGLQKTNRVGVLIENIFKLMAPVL